MGKETSRYRWRWALPVFGLLTWLSLGCSPQSLSMLMKPFGSDRADPKFKMFTSDKEVNLVILTNFTQPDLRPETAPIETELAEKVTQFVQSRCQENKHKVKIVPSAQVRSYMLKQLADGEFSPVEAGKHFKADFVLDLEIQSCELYEKKSHRQLYNGKAEIGVRLYKMHVKDGDRKVFSEDYHGAYPGELGPKDASSMTTTQFRGIFLNIMARDISKMFIAYPDQERMQID
jgi:hypothetical protein